MLIKFSFIVDSILVTIIIFLLSFVAFGLYKNYLNEFRLRECSEDVDKNYKNSDQNIKTLKIDECFENYFK